MLSTTLFTAAKIWHVDYKPNRQHASLRSDKTGWIGKDEATETV